MFDSRDPAPHPPRDDGDVSIDVTAPTVPTAYTPPTHAPEPSPPLPSGPRLWRERYTSHGMHILRSIIGFLVFVTVGAITRDLVRSLLQREPDPFANPRTLTDSAMARVFEAAPDAKAAFTARARQAGSYDEAMRIGRDLTAHGLRRVAADQHVTRLRLLHRIAVSSAAAGDTTFCASVWTGGADLRRMPAAIARLTPAEQREWADMSTHAMIAELRGTPLQPRPSDEAVLGALGKALAHITEGERQLLVGVFDSPTPPAPAISCWVVQRVLGPLTSDPALAHEAALYSLSMTYSAR
jgi:hypothetical protein